MRLIGLAALMTVALAVVPLDALAGEATKDWYLLEPPVDETSNVLFGILNQAPLAQWKRIATYDTEATCEYKRNEAVQASRDETQRLAKTSPLPKLEIFKGAYRDSGLANSSICVAADDPRLTSGSTR
jgi:hypothetical protein